MKRLFYSTIAVLAFSVSGMANTIEIYDLETSTIEDTFLDCYIVAETAMQEHNAETGYLMNYREQYAFFAAAYDLCVSTGKCTNCLEPITISTSPN